MSDPRPIGVFDSGVGGLTVARELQRQAPGERIVYLADLAHFPYGPRPQSQVRELALDIIERLSRGDTKLVVIACNTATAAALNVARERFDMPIVGVIAPGAQAAAAVTRNGRVAVISTEGTLRSQEYVHAMKEANPSVSVLGVAAPELVDLVESGDAGTSQAEDALRRVVAPLVEWRADTIVLGCTHYPLLRATFARVIPRGIRIVDSAETTAARVCRILRANRLAAARGRVPNLEVIVTGSPDRFVETATRLFGTSIPVSHVVEHRPLLDVVPAT